MSFSNARFQPEPQLDAPEGTSGVIGEAAFGRKPMFAVEFPNAACSADPVDVALAKLLHVFAARAIGVSGTEPRLGR